MFRYQNSDRFLGAIRPQGNFNSQQTAEALYKAMRGIGCNKSAVINLITTINNQQRQEVIQQYKALYGKDLDKKLIKELHGDFEDLIIALLSTPAEYDVIYLHDAMNGIGTKEKHLIEVVCSRTNEQMNAIKVKYEQKYGKTLESAIKGDVSGDFENLLVALIQAHRDESSHVNQSKAREDAEKIAKDGEKRMGTVESTFISILVSQNFFQLQEMFHAYERLMQHSIVDAIKKEFSGDIRDGLITLAQNIGNQANYFALQLYDSMKGLGTHDKDLIRIIVTRSEVDLAVIRQEYEQSYGVALANAIKSECSGAYRDALLSLVHGN